MVVRRRGYRGHVPEGLRRGADPFRRRRGATLARFGRANERCAGSFPAGSHSVRDRSRLHPIGRLGHGLASRRRRTTAGSTAADPRSRPIRVLECERRRQHSCMGHAGRAEEVLLPLVAFPLSPSRFGPRRSAPDRPDSTFWTRIRSAHESQSSSSARESASWAKTHPKCLDAVRRFVRVRARPLATASARADVETSG